MRGKNLSPVFPSLLSLHASSGQDHLTDTDPRMLFAQWEMESGADPEECLEETEGAVVVYDKFRPRIAKAR